MNGITKGGFVWVVGVCRQVPVESNCHHDSPWYHGGTHKEGLGSDLKN